MKRIIATLISVLAALLLLGGVAFAGTSPNVWTATCPANSSTSAPGCGAHDSAPAKGQAPGFLAGQVSQPNLIDVQQDPWTGAAGKQTITEQSYQSWQLTAAAKDPSNAPGEVLSYPSVVFNYFQLNTAASNYTAPPAGYDLDHVTQLTSDYTESMPSKTANSYQAHAAYDIWLNNWATEVMVWNDLAGQSRDRSVDGDLKVGTYTFHGQKWTLWDNLNDPKNPTATDKLNGYYAWVNDSDNTTATVYLDQMLHAMTGPLKLLPAASPLTQIGYGWEISDTGGKSLSGFAISKFGITLRG